MRVIFLDIDGVLSNLSHYRVKAKDWVPSMLDPKNVAALNELVAWTSAKVVVSSDWRLRQPLPALRRTLTSQRLDADIIDRTPELPGRERHEEIQTWLDSTEYNVESFVILDDDEMGPLRPYLVRTAFSTGLTSADVERAARILLG